MEAQAIDLHAVLNSPHVSMETKISYLTSLKSEIKHRQVPATAVPPIFNVVRSAISCHYTSLQAAGFSTLSHLLKRLSLQDQSHLIAAQCSDTLPILASCLGDAKDRVRSQAAQAFTDFWHFAPGDAEHYVLNIAIKENHRAKEACMQWLVKMNKQHGVLVRPHVPKLVDFLEDADAGVRDTAKMALIELFRNTPDHVKGDLKRQLQARNTRKMVASTILSQIGIGSSTERESHPRPISRNDRRKMGNGHSRPVSALSAHGQDELMRSSAYTIGSKGASKNTSTTSQGNSNVNASLSADSLNDAVEPLNVYSNRELDDIFRDMTPHFEGRESEHNWMARDKAVMQLRRITRGNAPKDYFATYSAGIKALYDGILKASNSLRTTLSSNGCLLVQDVTRACPAALEPMAEVIILNFIKMCAGTKKISAQNGNATVDALLSNLPYHARFLHHVRDACQEKNVQPRLFATVWIKNLITHHSNHKSTIEHSGSLEILETCISKGLVDANPGVRENMRGTFWAFATMWPNRGEMLISKLDTKSQDMLRKHSANTGELAFSTESANPIQTQAFSKSTTSLPGRRTLKETIAAQKRAKLAARKAADRPESAQSSYSTSHAPQAIRPTIFGSRSKTTGTSHAPSGVLSSRPVRPPRRPEINRPATAEPYAARNALRSGTPTGSPEMSSPKARPKTLEVDMTRKIPVELAKTLEVDSAKTPVDLAKTLEVDLTQARPKTPAMSENLTQSRKTPVDLAKALEVDLSQTRMTPVDLTQTRQTPVQSLSQGPKAMAKTNSEASPESAVSSPTIKNEELTMLIPTLHSSNIQAPAGDKACEAVKVYEDPLPSDEVARHTLSPATAVLEELPINDSVSNSSPNRINSTVPNDKLTLQFTSKLQNENSSITLKAAPIITEDRKFQKEKQLLSSGISKIKNGSIDVHGFRKIQGLIRNNSNLFEDFIQYDELLSYSLEALEAPLENGRGVKDQDLKTQILGTIRLLHEQEMEHFSKSYPQALIALLKARRHYTIRNHLVSGLEQAMDMIIQHCQDPKTCISSVLDLLKSEETLQDKLGRRTLAMGLYCLAGLLHQVNQKHEEIEESQQQILGELAHKCLQETDSDVRRAVIDYAMEVYDQVHPSERFWGMLKNEVTHRDLLTYYLGRREQRRT